MIARKISNLLKGAALKLCPWSLWRCNTCGSVLCCMAYPIRRHRTICRFCISGEDCKECNGQAWIDLRQVKRTEGQS